MPVGIIIIILAGYYGLVGNETTLFDVIFYPILSVIYYERLGPHITDTNNQTGEQSASRDRCEPGCSS